MVWQFNTPLSISGGYLSDEVVAKDELMKDFIDEQSFLKSRIVSLREDIESIENAISKIGYSANETEADPVAYEALASCCKIGS